MIVHCERREWTDDLPGPYMTRIDSYANVYGFCRPFCDFWVQRRGDGALTAVLHRIDNTVTLEAFQGADYAELKAFLRFAVPGLYLLCSQESFFSLSFTQQDAGAVMQKRSFPKTVDAPSEVEITECCDSKRLANLLEECAGDVAPGDVDSWRADFCHRRNQNSIIALTARLHGMDIGCAMTVAQTKGQAVIGGVAVLPGWRGYGVGSLLVQTLCLRLEPILPFLFLKEDKLPFYRLLGFDLIGKWQSGRIE